MTAVVVMSPQELEELVSRAVGAGVKTALESVDTRAEDKPELWDATNVADFLKVSPRQVSECYAFMKGFPASVCLPTPSGTKRTRRWVPEEIREWAKSKKERRAA